MCYFLKLMMNQKNQLYKPDKLYKLMRIEQFEDIISWQKGIELSMIVYDIFRNNKDYGFRDQIQRAAVSVSNNIAEGFERQSNKELSKFLYIAKGSAGEVRSMLSIAIKLNYINQTQFNDLQNRCIEISRLLSGFIKTIC